MTKRSHIYHHTWTTYQHIQLPVSHPIENNQDLGKIIFVVDSIPFSLHFLSIFSIPNLYVIFFVSMPWNEVYIHQSLMIYYFKHLYNAICKDNDIMIPSLIITSNIKWSWFLNNYILSQILHQATIPQNKHYYPLNSASLPWVSNIIKHNLIDVVHFINSYRSSDICWSVNSI